MIPFRLFGKKYKKRKILKDDDKKDLIKVGDRIIFSKYAGTEVKLDKKEYIVVKIADVLAVVED